MRAIKILRVCQVAVLPFLLLVHVLAQWLILPHLHSLSVFGRFDAGICGEGLWGAQLILLAGWAALGPWRWYVRWPLTIGGMVLLLWPPEAGLILNGVTRFWFPTWVGMATTFVVALGFFANHLRGRQLQIIDGPEPPSVPLRFSIRLICLITAISAVLVRGGMMHRSYLGDTLESELQFLGTPFVSIWYAAGMTGLTLGVCGLLSFWAVLSPGGTWWRMLLLAAAIGLFGVAIPWGASKERDIVVVLEWYAAASVFVAGTLFVMRSVGYRWMKASTFQNTQTTAKDENAKPKLESAEVARPRWRSANAITSLILLASGLAFGLQYSHIGNPHGHRSRATEELTEWSYGPFNYHFF